MPPTNEQLNHKKMTSKYEEAFAKFECRLDDEQVSREVSALIADNRAKYDTPETLRYLLTTVELTTLLCTDNDNYVMQMTDRVNDFFDEHDDLKPIATICVYPRFAAAVKAALRTEGVRIACVSGGFPASQTFLEVKTIETALALKDGADEIDMVLSVGAFQDKDYETCADEISELKDVCGEAPLKVILETGELKQASEIMKASVLAMYSGADYIKTSTGKVAVAATPEAAYVMCKAIKRYHELEGRWVGFKAAGGIKTPAEAVDFYTIVREVLGQEFIDLGLFRIGTSSLANKLAGAILEEEGQKYF